VSIVNEVLFPVGCSLAIYAATAGAAVITSMRRPPAELAAGTS
jgi:hypothetical protein